MKKALRNPNVTPPGGWRYVDPDTGFAYDRQYHNLLELLDHIMAYRAQNKLAVISGLQAVVENWLCFQPDMERYSKDVPQARRSFSQYISGAKAYARAKLGNDADYLCSQEEAEARGKVCLNCFHNEIPKEKSKLEELADVKIAELVGERTSARDRGLFMCSVCSCPLRAKIHFAKWFIEENLEQKTRYLVPSGLPGKDGKPVYCWQIHPLREEIKDGTSSK